MHHFLHQSTAVKSLATYGVLSVIHALLARIVMTKFFFDYPIVLIMFNMALTLACIEIGRLTKLLKIQAYTFSRSKEMFLPSFFYSLAQYISLNCLDGITLPFFPFLQKFIALLVVPFYFLFLRRQCPSIQTLLLLFCICVGSAMSSVYEVSFDLWGLAYSLAALGMTTASLVLMERINVQQNMSALELIYLNSFNCLCIFLVADIVQDEVRDAYMYLQTSTTSTFYICLIWMVLLGSLVHGALLFSIASANTLNAAVIHNCAAAIQVIIAYGLSIQVFYDSDPDFSAVLGIMIVLGAAVLYFVSPTDRDLKPDGKASRMVGPGGVKYHMLAQS